MNPSEDDADGGTNLNKVGSIDSEGRGRGLRSLSRERAKEAIIPGINLEEELPPPLPPRPSNPSSFETPPSTLLGSLRHSNKSLRPQLQSTSTTAVSLTDIHAHTIQNGSQETFASISEREHSKGSPALNNSFGRHHSRSGSEADESGSVKSYVPTIEVHGDVESLLGDVLGGEESPAWKLLSSHGEGPDPFDLLEQDEGAITVDFSHEFGELDEVSEDGDNEGIYSLILTSNTVDVLNVLCLEALITQWRSKRKHFLILSSAGKPIYNRHGDDNLISSYIGVIQTIISFYQSASDSLKGFTAGGVRFVIMIQGPLYLVAISRLAESDAQLRVQLEALYMQILSTLTLPTLTQLFSNRPSTDLRRPLQGTEPLLSALADSFTRGSPPTLLSALECLKLRKSHRQVIDNTLLKVRSDNLLYGLIVAGGRLVSVVRPKRHSLHPGDLQLIFNMLFEAGGVKAGGGESWIPLCLPGFNKNGYLYMFVSFLSSRKDDEAARTSPSDNAEKEDEVVVLLISAKKESFFDLRKMRDELVDVGDNLLFWYSLGLRQ